MARVRGRVVPGGWREDQVGRWRGGVYILYEKNQKKRVRISSPGLSFLQTAALSASGTEIPGPSMGTRPGRRVGGRQRWFLGDAWVPGVPWWGRRRGQAQRRKPARSTATGRFLGNRPARWRPRVRAARGRSLSQTRWSGARRSLCSLKT